MRLRALALASILLTAPAYADVEVRFIEGAPKDRFVFAYEGACDTGPATLTVDLSGSPAGLVFDVTGDGAGVEVFQPFELVSGAEVVTVLPDVKDGDTALSLDVQTLVPGSSVSFTIDLDDTIGAREITVSGSEIAGAETRLSVGEDTVVGVFGSDATATLEVDGCLS